jgi:DNA-directed RNA polymerase subunit RPC12/RpoP
MADPAAELSPPVVCPHCGKEFEGELLESSETAGPRGFKCPHCRLFVPEERANPAAS